MRSWEVMGGEPGALLSLDLMLEYFNPAAERATEGDTVTDGFLCSRGLWAAGSSQLKDTTPGQEPLQVVGQGEHHTPKHPTPGDWLTLPSGSCSHVSNPP